MPNACVAVEVLPLGNLGTNSEATFAILALSVSGGRKCLSWERRNGISTASYACGSESCPTNTPGNISARKRGPVGWTGP